MHDFFLPDGSAVRSLYLRPKGRSFTELFDNLAPILSSCFFGLAVILLFMRAEMALKVKPYIEERARERSRANLKQNAESASAFTESQKISTDTGVQILHFGKKG